MIKIICTKKNEKENIMKCLLEAESCPFCVPILCPESFNCRECAEDNIVWEVEEEDQ